MRIFNATCFFGLVWYAFKSKRLLGRRRKSDGTRVPLTGVWRRAAAQWGHSAHTLGSSCFPSETPPPCSYSHKKGALHWAAAAGRSLQKRWRIRVQLSSTFKINGSTTSVFGGLNIEALKNSLQGTNPSSINNRKTFFPLRSRIYFFYPLWRFPLPGTSHWSWCFSAGCFQTEPSARPLVWSEAIWKEARDLLTKINWCL